MTRPDATKSAQIYARRPDDLHEIRTRRTAATDNNDHSVIGGRTRTGSKGEIEIEGQNWGGRERARVYMFAGGTLRRARNAVEIARNDTPADVITARRGIAVESPSE